MTGRTIAHSPQFYARLAGALYLVIILFGGFSEGYVASKLVVPEDAAATARNIVRAWGLWRISVAGNLVIPLIAIGQLWIEYLLLKPVSRNLTLLFALFTIGSLAVESVSKSFLLMVTYLLDSTGHVALFAAPQAATFAYMALVLHDISFNIALLLFACACVIEGYLIFHSRYLPRALGMLMQLAGACYFIAAFSALVLPELSKLLGLAILIPPLVGELSLALWLLVKGVDVAEWRARVDGLRSTAEAV